MTSRKKIIVKMVKQILTHKAAYNSFITAPNIKFNDFNEAVEDYYDYLHIDDCDQPRVPILKIMKIGFSSVRIEWKMDPIDINGAKPVQEFIIEYAALPKKFRKKIKLKDALKKERKKNKKSKKKKKKKRRKRKSKRKRRRDSDSESDSDASSNSESESESESDSDSASSSDDSDSSSSNSESDSNDSDDDDDEKGVNEEFDENEIDIDALKWIGGNDKKSTFKVKAKSLKKNKFKIVIEDLKDEWPYVVRICGRNESGWGKFCKPIKFQTNKLVIDSKILSNKQKVKLMQWTPKGKKRRWYACIVFDDAYM